MKLEIKPDEEVVVKISSCGICSKQVRVAIKHMMSKKDINSFAKEAMEYNLAIKELPLLEYRLLNPNWCECNSKKE